jgi:Fe-S-cluster containining protein
MKKDYRGVLQKIIRLSSKEADNLFNELHQKEFEKIDCLQCAKCCRDLGPLLTDRDIQKLSQFLKIKPSAFTEKYLRIDEDGDYVFKSMPCPFIGNDNYCAVYESRPTACRDYPHTDRKNIKGILDICIKNAAICPAVENILAEIDRRG